MAINWGRVLEDEGYKTNLYTLDNKESGVTMLGGIDVGQGTKDKLYGIIETLGIPEDKVSEFKGVIDKVAGLKGDKAIEAFGKLTNEERNIATNFLASHGSGIQNLYNKQEESNIAATYNKIAGKDGIKFEDLYEGWQNVIASSYHQYGAEGVSKQKLYGQIAKGEFGKAISNLQNWGDTTDKYADSINARYERYGNELVQGMVIGE